MSLSVSLSLSLSRSISRSISLYLSLSLSVSVSLFSLRPTIMYYGRIKESFFFSLSLPFPFCHSLFRSHSHTHTIPPSLSLYSGLTLVYYGLIKESRVGEVSFSTITLFTLSFYLSVLCNMPKRKKGYINLCLSLLSSRSLCFTLIHAQTHIHTSLSLLL